MKQRLRLDGVDHDMDSLSPEAQQLVARLRFVQQRLQDLHNRQAILTKARNAYIADLKTELLRPSGGAGPGAGGAALPAFLRDDDTF